MYIRKEKDGPSTKIAKITSILKRYIYQIDPSMSMHCTTLHMHNWSISEDLIGLLVHLKVIANVFKVAVS